MTVYKDAETGDLVEPGIYEIVRSEAVVQSVSSSSWSGTRDPEQEGYVVHYVTQTNRSGPRREDSWDGVEDDAPF